MVRITSAVVLFLTLMGWALAQDNQSVEYAGGTVPNLKAGTEGRLDTTDTASLNFEYSSGKLAIPFKEIESYEHTRDVVHHLGVLPAIAVGLLRTRKRAHFVRINYRDDSNGTQVALFKVPKQMPPILLPVLDARAPCATTHSKCAGGGTSPKVGGQQ